ncbi:MAG: response regulator, partial [Sedimentisphaerales bacterium]
MGDKFLKILLIEDSISDAALLQAEVLQSSTGDHRIQSAGSLKQAIDSFKEDNFDAALLDLNLPDSSGLDTVRYFRSSQPDVPIVVLTGYEDEKTGIEAVRMGAQDYLVKGKSEGSLIVRAVRYAIERKKMEVELRRARDDLETRIEERTRTIRHQAKFIEAYFQHSLTTVIILDLNFNFLRVNDEFAGICQKRAKDFPGHNFFEFFPDTKTQEIFENTVKTQMPYIAYAKPFDFVRNAALGTAYFDWTLVPILAENGRVGFLVLSLKDVTERVEAEQKVLAYQEQLRALSGEIVRVEENERRKLAVELHDSIGQTLAFLKIELGRVQRLQQSKESVETIQVLRK